MSDLTLHDELIQMLANKFTVSTLCVVLGVSRTACYGTDRPADTGRGQSYQPTAEKQDKKRLVEQVFWAHKRRYGSRRIVAELQEQGHQMGRQQVRSLIKAGDLQSIQPRSFVPRTTDGIHRKGYWPNLLLGQPMPVAPNLVWVSDITYLALVNGEWAYLGAWMEWSATAVVLAPNRWLAGG